MVSSYDKQLTKYTSRTCMQMNHQEFMDSIQPMVTASMKKYMDHNGQLPTHIVIYRDGVGDGMLPLVFEHELPQFLKCLQTMGAEDYNPKVAFIVVKKRITTRFFMPTNGRGYANPPPGSVIDSAVTHPEWYDFYLTSQSVREGTVAPTAFNVIHDTTGLKPDHLQRLTYKLTHIYYNWPGTVRVPAPCQYAHKLAFLTGQSLHAHPDVSLSDKLFFL